MKVSLPLSILPSFVFFVFCFFTPLDPLSVFHFHPFHSFFSFADPLFIFMALQWPIRLFSALRGSRLSFPALLSPHLPILPVSSSFLKSSLGSPLSLDVHSSGVTILYHYEWALLFCYVRAWGWGRGRGV